MDFALEQIETKTLAEHGVEVPLNNLAGNPLLNAKKEPISLSVLGSDSATYRRLDRERGRKQLDRLQKTRSKSLTDEQLDQAEKDDIEFIAKVTTGWSGFLDTKEKPIPFSLENVIDLYTKYPIAREQAAAAIVDRSRFIRPSLKG